MSAIDKWGYTAIFDDGSSVIGDSEQDLRNKIGNRKPALIYHYEGKDWEGYECTR